MRTSKAVTVVHPDSRTRIALRTLLEAHGCSVATDHSCLDLMSGVSEVRPDLILVDRSLLEHEGLDVLSQLNHKWEESEVIYLPADMNSSHPGFPGFAEQLLRIIDRLLALRTTRDILAV